MIQPADFGPIYAETLTGRFPVEPWSTFSNLIFVFVFINFFRRIRHAPEKYPITSISLLILLIGFIGGTIYHATRSHNLWLILDFVPIGILVILGTIYFWYKLTGKLWISILLLVSTLGGTRLLSFWFITDRHIRISCGYIVLAMVILVPAFLLSRKYRWSGRQTLIRAVVYFSGVTSRSPKATY